MARFGFLIVVILLGFQLDSEAQNVKADFDCASFYAPDKGPYVETYIAFHRNSLSHILNKDSIMQASVEITMLFTNADAIKEYRKYKVVSPILPELEENSNYFIDLQRIAIPEGIYNFQLIITDNYGADTVKEYKTNKLISVNIPDKQLALSDIELLKSYVPSDIINIYVKDGYECTPYISDNYTQEVDYLRFYAELYNGAKQIGPLEDFIVACHIEEINTSKPIKEFSSTQVQQAVNKNVIFKEISIKNLPTGNYYLVLEIRDKLNKPLVSSMKYFQKQNGLPVARPLKLKNSSVGGSFVAELTNIDTLKHFIKALKPISDLSERTFIDSQLQVSDLKVLQQFFYTFWQCRYENIAELKWIEYHSILNEVEKRFGTENNIAYETPRGQVCLQYGLPNSISLKKDKSSSIPYEIWQYYRIADQMNVEFIFYNKSQIPNEYELVYTNKKGLQLNTNWLPELHLDDADGMISE